MTVPAPPTPARFAPHRVAALRDRLLAWGPSTFAHGGFPEREFDALRQEGLLAVTLPGGVLAPERNNTAGLLHLLREIGHGNLSVGRIYEGHVNALHLIGLYATPRQRERWFAEARDGHLFSVWNTEMSDGIQVHDAPGGRIRLQGSKSFCSGSTWVTRPLITGRRKTGDLSGWQMVVVPLDEHAPEVDTSFWSPVGMRNSASHKLDFTGIELPADDLLGQPDDYNRQPHFSGGAIRFAAVQLGGAAALLGATRDYLREQQRTTDPYQRTRVGQMAILVESGNLWLDRAGAVADGDGDPAATVHHANMVRTAIAGYCEECLALAQRCVGSRGLLPPHPLAGMVADLNMYLRQPAPDASLEAVGKTFLDGSVND
ncbi:acyl-CoA dehydrogenase family protein [Lewinella sp. IMCC34183]|uniref:acyl-CoA dehydrogenase family protein n=1 Tax=Lewinella sp. IMCC34183 TaxID=2248762 RepID=UPI000E242BE0|nr:acyl-CoA dehydrogenase family protein [Lewinella sp. IMCC34183]